MPQLQLRPTTTLVLWAALAVPAVLAAPQGRGALSGGPGALLRSADANGDGIVDAQEWQALLDQIAPDPQARLDASRVKAWLLPLDVNGDGRLTVQDVEAVLAVLDDDGDGAVSAQERERPPGRRAGFEELMLTALVAEAADADGDGAIARAEREAFVGALSGAIPRATVEGWVRKLAGTSGRERALFSPAVMLAELDPQLDRDQDGRLTRADLEALFVRADADGDGRLSAAELAPQRRERPAAGAGGEEPQWAVSSEQRARPPAMPWERSLEDALRVWEATGKPLLLCVNMNGEPASENLAGGRYRDPGFAELARGFVPLIASPDQHVERERDDAGRRQPCTRFGRVLCSEHIGVEPALFERYFSGQRFAPRHVGVAADGTVLFDLYLLNDLSIVDRALREHGRPDAVLPDPAELSEDALLERGDAAARGELERRFAQGDATARAQTAALALSKEREVQHPELVRVALRDEDAAVRRQGAWTFAQNPAAAPLDAAPDALGVGREDPALLAAIARALEERAAASADAQVAARARRLAAVASALVEPSALVDPDLWVPAVRAGATVAAQPSGDALAELGAAIEQLSAAAQQRPQDAELRAQLAQGWLRFAETQLASGGNPSFALQDADAAARRALELDPEHARALGVRARASWLLGEAEAALELSERALPRLRGVAGSELAHGALEAFVGARTRALYERMSADEAWPARWAADLIGASRAQLAHPAATEGQWKAYLQLLETLEAHPLQADAVRAALAQHPASGDLHDWLRYQVLRDGGARALEAAYEEDFLAGLAERDPAVHAWFHGLATLLAAERDVRDGRPEEARAAYERSARRFEESAALAPDYAASAGHYRALALAGLARLEAEAGELEAATEHLLAALEAPRETLDTADGLGRKPLDTAGEVQAQLARAGAADLATRLAQRLGELGAAQVGPLEAGAATGG